MSNQQQIETAAKDLAALNGRDWSDMGEQERLDYRYEALRQAEHVEWHNERAGVFAGRLNGRIIGRVVGELQSWDWAHYRDAWTGDAGKADSFAAACAAVERAHKE